MTTVTFDPAKLDQVPLEQIHPNPWNPKTHDPQQRDFRKVVKSLRENGLRLPIVVREIDDGYQVLDGEQRWRASLEIGLDEVPIYNEGKIDDGKAKSLTIWYQQQVPFDEILEAALAVQLHNEDVPLPYDEAELNRMRELVEFDASHAYEDTEVPLPNPTRSLAFELEEEQYRMVRDALNQARNDVGYDNDAAVLVAWAEGQA